MFFAPSGSQKVLVYREALLLHMVSIPIPSDVPGPDRATKDIAGALRGMRDVSCGLGSLPLYLVAIAKSDNTALPLYMPVPYADVEGRVLGAGFVPVKTVSARTNSDGVASACVPILPTVWYDFMVRKSGVDFGRGEGEWSDRVRRLKDIMVVKGTKMMPCPPARIPVAASNFNRLDYRPNITTLPLRVDYEGYGSVDVGGNFRIYIGGVQVGSGRVEPGSRIDHTMPSALKDLGSIRDLLGKSVTVKVEIDHGACTFIGEQTVSLPSFEVERPHVKLCEKWNTIAKPSIPSRLKTPFEINIYGANWICQDTDKMTPIDAIAEVSINGSRFNLPIRSGSGRLSLTDYEISNIIKGVKITASAAGVSVPTRPAEEEFEVKARKEGRLGTTAGYIVPLREVQAFLGVRGIAEPQPPGSSWYGAYKITRRNGTYFWATTWQDIERWL